MERTNILAPSILSADFKNLERDIDAVIQGGAKYLHIDVMDGMFVPSISFGMPVIKSIRSGSDILFDVHLMIEEPIRYIKDFKDSGADIITVHYEACSDVRETLESIRDLGLKAGLSIKPGTDVEAVREFQGVCDMILLMSVEPGFGGQKFMEPSIERAQALRVMIDEYCGSSPASPDSEPEAACHSDELCGSSPASPDSEPEAACHSDELCSSYSALSNTEPEAACHNIDLEIDGGIKLDNVQRVLDAGVNIIVAGSAVFNDPYANTVKFMEILNQK